MRTKITRTLWVLLLLIHGGSILVSVLPSESFKPKLNPQKEVPGFWAFEESLVSLKSVIPGRGLVHGYNRFFGFNQRWLTFAPVPPVEQKHMRVMAETPQGSSVLLWSAPRSVDGWSSDYRTFKFLETVVRDESARRFFLDHFYRLHPQAKRVVLLMERVTVPRPSLPSKSTGEYILQELKKRPKK